jgi:hypothetical protein
VFSWTPFRLTKTAVKLYQLLDPGCSTSAFIHISDRTMHEGNILDQQLSESGTLHPVDLIKWIMKSHMRNVSTYIRKASELERHENLRPGRRANGDERIQGSRGDVAR